MVAPPSVLGVSFESNIVPSLAVMQSRLALSDAQLRVMVVPLLAMLELRHRELRRVAASCDAWRECCSALSSGGASGGAEGLTTSGSAP